MEEKSSHEVLIDHYKNASEEEKKQIEIIVCEAFAPLVSGIAQKCNYFSRNSVLTQEDMVQNGYQGLLKALHTYDPSKNTKFLTYAFNCVQKAILSGIREVNIGGRSKSYSNGKLQKYRKMKRELTQKLGRNPSVGELSIELGWQVNTVLTYERQLYDKASIENSCLLDFENI